MASHDAVCIDRTSTWVNTFLVLTGQHLRTVIVHDTFRFTTNLVGVAEVARRADTPGLMGSNLTYSFYTALLIIARVLAFPLYTCLGEGAFKVTLATS